MHSLQFSLLFFCLAPERSLAAWQFILCISRTLQVLRGMSLKMFSEKQTSEQTPSRTDLLQKTHRNLRIFQWFLGQDRTLEFLQKGGIFLYYLPVSDLFVYPSRNTDFCRLLL